MEVNQSSSSSLNKREWQCHSKQMTCMKVSKDRKFVFTASEDGSVCMFRIRYADLKAQDSTGYGQELASIASFSDEVFVARKSLEEKTEQIKMLRHKMEEFRLDAEHQLRSKDICHEETLERMENIFQTKMTASRTRHENLINDKQQSAVTRALDIEQMETKHAAQFSHLKKTHEEKMESEAKRYEIFCRERDERRADWDRENKRLVEEQTSFLQELAAKYNDKMAAEKQLQETIAKEMEALSAKSATDNELMEEDADYEFEAVRQKYEAKLASEKENTTRLREEYDDMKDKYTSLVTNLDGEKKRVETLLKKQEHIRQVLKEKEDIIAAKKEEVRERDEMVAKKEEEIQEFERKNQDLKRFKQQLNEKIKELRQRLEPRELELSKLTTQCHELEIELHQSINHNDALKLNNNELRLKIAAINKEIKKQENQIDVKKAAISSLQNDILAVINGATTTTSSSPTDENREENTDYGTLKSSLFPLFKKYSGDGGGASVAGRAVTVVAAGDENDSHNVVTDSNTGVATACRRQRQHLLKNIENIKTVSAKMDRGHIVDVTKLQREKGILIKELNDLRRESKYLEHQEREMLEKCRDESLMVFRDGGDDIGDSSSMLAGPLIEDGLPIADSYYSVDDSASEELR